jgi:Flp pilus assembly protein protease CpaA
MKRSIITVPAPTVGIVISLELFAMGLIGCGLLALLGGYAVYLMEKKITNE